MPESKSASRISYFGNKSNILDYIRPFSFEEQEMSNPQMHAQFIIILKKYLDKTMFSYFDKAPKILYRGTAKDVK